MTQNSLLAAFSTNMADTNIAKYNYNQQHKKPKQPDEKKTTNKLRH